MKRTILRRAFLPCLLLAALPHASLFPAQAQTTAAPANLLPQTSDKQNDTLTTSLLQHMVHLHLGSVTAQQAVSALAMQSGLRIYCEEYLQNRKMIVQIEGVTAQTALDTLAELNDWRWFRKEDGQIWLTRRRAVIPQTLAELPAALRANLPKDYRPFFGLGMTTKDLPEQMMLAPNGTLQKRVNTYSLKLQEKVEREERITSRLGNLARIKKQDIFDTFGAALADGKTLSWDKLTDGQKADIQDVILLRVLNDLCQTFYVHLLDSGLPAYAVNMDEAELQLQQGNGFLIGHALNGSYMGFGTAIPGLQSSASPRLPVLKNPIPAQEGVP